jgi:hypothetical protein
MKTRLACLALLISVVQAVPAQDHLVPKANAFVQPDPYLLKVRHIFAQALEEGVILSALVLPSFQDEYAVGLRVEGEAVEAFVLEPSSRIWDTELVRLFENGEIRQYDLEGKKVPPEKSMTLKKLKARTPADYRNIKATRRARPIPGELAVEIRAIWTTTLLDARRPAESSEVVDGVTYHFSAWLQRRREISRRVHSPDPESRTGRLTSLADAMRDYARGKADLSPLTKKLEQAK